MDTQSNKQSELSPWARSIKLAKQTDQREQPWKAALEVEKKAKADSTYDQIPDVSTVYGYDGNGGDDGSIRPCNF
jgi:hypothetical protein